jgi:zinc protease
MMRTLLTIATLCALAVPTAQASDALPAHAVSVHTLDNGLTVVVSEDDRLPVVAVELRYLVGSAHERAGRTGFAHLFEHLMFQGSAHYDDEYFKPFEPIGGSVNGTTNTDRTNYFERVPSNYLELALWMEADRMGALLPVLTQEKLDNQRDVVKNERRQRYENQPYGMVFKYLTCGLYPKGHPYAHLTIGSHADLTAATLDDVRAFFERYYAPSNAILTIVGDTKTDQALALAKQYFGHLPAGERAPTPTAEMPVLDGPVHIRQTDEVKLPRVHLAWHTPAFYADGDAALDVLSSVLSRGKTSRLYQPLVYEQKVAKDVQAFQWSRQLGSTYVIQATAAPGKSIEELAAALDEAVKTALATPPTQTELDRAVNGWRKSFFHRVESVLERARLYSTYLHFNGKPDYLADDLARYTTLTPAQIHETAKRWLDSSKVVRVDIVPGDKPPAAAECPAPLETAAKGGAK